MLLIRGGGALPLYAACVLCGLGFGSQCVLYPATCADLYGVYQR